MRKNIKKFAGIVLCIGMFTGCAQTPDSSLVKPKGSKAVDAYTEADDVSGSKGEACNMKIPGSIILIGSFLAMPEYMSRLLTHTQVF